jgi:hypothetical protein
MGDITTSVILLRSGLETSIAHCITQGKSIKTFDQDHYLEECRTLFVNLGVPLDLVNEMLDEAETQGELDYVTGMLPDTIDTGSQIIPSANPRYLQGGTKLANLLRIK